jgi:hypothetical protein
MPPGLMQEAPMYMPQASVNDSHLGMRRSFNAAPAASAFPSNMPIYRSFDQGSLASFTRSGRVPCCWCSSNMKTVLPGSRY